MLNFFKKLEKDKCYPFLKNIIFFANNFSQQGLTMLTSSYYIANGIKTISKEM